MPYQAVYIGDVTQEDDPNCSWFGFHLHQSASASLSHPFCSNKFVDPSQGDRWQHKVFWVPVDHSNDKDCDAFKDNDEDYIGTDDEDDCTDQGGDADAWPPDIHIDTEVNLYDAMKYYEPPQAYGSKIGEPGYKNRLDLYVDGRIGLYDMMILVPLLGERCSP